jgi:NAD(P)-dependent dehydrogenase (short-subunit alcohol dehydrogenase family)
MRVLITGAATGIGAATAARLRATGVEVVGVDIVAGDGRLVADMTDPAAIDSIPLSGRFDALVNAAGLPPRDGLEARILSLNTMGLIRFTERVLPHMSDGGSIVSIASKAGAKWRQNLDQVRRFLALPGVADLPRFIAAEAIDPVRAYDLSKEAVILWTKSQTARLKEMGLRANTVSPAAIETALLPDFMTAFGARAQKGTELMGRAGTADEVAGAVAFLVSPESGWVKGIDLPVDGGLDARLELMALGVPEA